MVDPLFRDFFPFGIMYPYSVYVSVSNSVSLIQNIYPVRRVYPGYLTLHYGAGKINEPDILFGVVRPHTPACDARCRPRRTPRRRFGDWIFMADKNLNSTYPHESRGDLDSGKFTGSCYPPGYCISDSDFPKKREEPSSSSTIGESDFAIQAIPRAADISERAIFSGSLTATPCSFEASATFRPMARTQFL